jgi:hypothetical protein
MLYQLKKFKDLTADERNSFKEYCIDQSVLASPAATNMFGDGNNTLIYLLENSNRFDNTNGEFFILYIDGKIAACSGVYKSEFNKYIALAGTRTWTTTEFKNQNLHRNILLPAQKFWSINNNCKQVAICFNDYNKNLIAVPYRSRAGEGRIYRTSRHLFHSNINRVEFPVNIQNTKQWVLYEKLDPGWEFDWKSIEYVYSTHK